MAEHLIAGLHCADVRELAAGFVLGALEPAEADALRTHVAACPEPHPELAELGSVVPALLASAEPIEPSPGLKGRILTAAAGMPQVPDPQAAAGTQRATDTQGAATRGAVTAPAPVADTRRRGSWTDLFRRPIWAGVATAAVIAAVAFGAWSFALRAELDGYRNGVAAVLDAAGEPGAKLAVLAPPEGAAGPSGLAAVGADGSVTLVMKDLAPTTGAQVYEAWAIAGKNAPVPLGGFTVSASGTASFGVAHPSLGDGVTVALTLEPGPGATTPTLPIVAAGMAGAAS